jgi:hypothetical protein
MVGSGDLEQSLRAEIDGYIDSRLGGLRDEIARLQSQMNEAFTRLTERVESEGQTDASVAVSISEHLRNARKTGTESAAAEGARSRSSSEMAILKAAVDDIDEQRTQSDILNSLINRASSFAPRIAFFVVKNDRATGWRARGLEGTVGDDSVRELSLPLSSDTLLSEVARSRRTWSGAPGTHADDNQIYNHFGDNPPQRIVAVPLIARDRAVAVLYADCAEQDADAINLEAIETLTKVAGMAVELLATKRPTPDASGSAAASSSASAPQPTAAHAPEAATSEATPFTRDEPAPQPLTGAPQAETVDTVAAEQEEVHEAAPSPRFDEASFGGVETTTEPSSVYVEPEAPPPAIAAPPPGAARRPSARDELPIEVSEAESGPHKEAYRVARLLVDEIKLYNPEKVEQGLAEGDLYNRLREDIDRSRQHYDRRVKPEVAARYDYFHYVLVNKLAGGDSSKLGEAYPGAPTSA